RGSTIAFPSQGVASPKPPRSCSETSSAPAGFLDGLSLPAYPFSYLLSSHCSGVSSRSREENRSERGNVRSGLLQSACLALATFLTFLFLSQTACPRVGNETS